MSPSHQETHGSSYSNDSWMGLGGYGQSGHQQNGSQGQHGYHGYDYTASAPMPMEPSYTMNRPPPYATPHNPQITPLVMPTMWPSMMANSSSYQQPILPAVSTQTPLSATSIGSDVTPTSAKASASRRKLTDDERRLMCLEAEKHPGMKQTQIGAKFSVERSTVSKILRQKDKYLKAQSKEEVTSPGRKNKTKLPNVEKTLTNWARNQQKRGLSLSIDELRKQVLMFTSGRSDQQVQVYTTTEWLENFRKGHLDGSPRSGSREDTAETSTSHSETLDNSPISSSGLVSPPMSAIEGHSNHRSKREDDIFDFDAVEYEHSPSLPHGFTSVNVSSEALLSPISPEISRDYVSSQFAEHTPTDATFPRQRSMTLPHLAPGSNSRPASSNTSLPHHPVRSLTTIDEARQSSIDPRQMMKRHKSVPDIHDAETVRYSTMQPPPLPRSADISPTANSPTSQDETISRALHQMKQLLEQRPDVAEPDDYVMIGKLMEKFKLMRTRSPTNTPSLPGGMRHMDVMSSPRLSKKRTMVQMSM